MIELDDCGRELHLQANKPWSDSMDVKVQMVIKAPRGTLTLFHNKPRPGVFNRLSGTYTFPKQTKQCKAIEAFMKEYKDDTKKTTTKNT